MALRDLYEGYLDPKPVTHLRKKSLQAYVDDVAEAFYDAMPDFTDKGIIDFNENILKAMSAGDMDIAKRAIQGLEYEIAAEYGSKLINSFSDVDSTDVSDSGVPALLNPTSPAIRRLINKLKKITAEMNKYGKQWFPDEPDHEPAAGPVEKAKNTIADTFRKLLFARFPNGELTARQAKELYTQAKNSVQGVDKKFSNYMSFGHVLLDLGAKFSHSSETPRWQGGPLDSREGGKWPSLKDYVRIKIEPKEPDEPVKEGVRLKNVFRKR